MLTKREHDTLEAIKALIQRLGMSPTVAEIASALNISSRGTVHRYVQALLEKGFLRRMEGRARGLMLVENLNTDQVLPQIPLLGKIAAGKPIEAITDSAFLDPSVWFERGDLYALRVDGDSMIEAGILDQDYVLCRPASAAGPHQVAVVLVDNQEVTLKYCHKNTNGTITLKPANRKLKSQTFNAERVQIQGIVVSQLRHYG